MQTLNLSIGVAAASILRFIILETAITLVAAPLFTKSLENLSKQLVLSGQSVRIRAIDFGWLTPVNVAYSKIGQSHANETEDRKSGSVSWKPEGLKQLISVVVKLVAINTLLLAAVVSTEMTAGATNERVVLRKPVRRHSDVKGALAAISLDHGALLDRMVEIERCTQGMDALHYQVAEGFCRARETEPSAWATVRGIPGELLEEIGDQSLITIDQWTNNTFQAVTVMIEGHSENRFFWRNNQVTMYCHALRKESELKVGNVYGHCAVMFNAATPRILNLVKVHHVTDVADLELTVDRSDYIDVLAIELDDADGAEHEIMFVSVTIAKRYLAVGVSIAEDRIIQEYYTQAATMSKILRTMIDGYGGDAEQIGEYYVDRILATQSMWSIVFLSAVIVCSIVIRLATRKKTDISVPFDISGLMKKLATIDEGEACISAGKWPILHPSKANCQYSEHFHDFEDQSAKSLQSDSGLNLN